MNTPASLGKYQIRRELGQGAMGIVYEGFDPAIQRRVAIKTLKRSSLERTESAEILTRFEREAQAAGRLSHPNIVPIYEYGEDDGTAFIAMEFIEGRELKDYFDKGERFPIREIQRVMGQLLDALDFSHRRGVVHRDIKPANIILLRDGTVKVTDFGIARIESSTLTQAGSVLGTPAYMSPEQFSGQTVDGRSDIFSAGVVLYQFLTGERPFTGTFSTIMHKVLKENPLPPSELNVQAPRGFDAVVAKALAKRPDERFQTAGEFKSAILALCTAAAEQGAAQRFDADATLVDNRSRTAKSSPQVRTEATIKTVVTPRTTGQEPDRGRASPSPQPRKSSTLTGVLVLAAILLAGGAAAAYLMLGGQTAVQTARLEAREPASGAAGSGVNAPAAAATAAAPLTPPVLPPLAPGPAADTDVLPIVAMGLADPADPKLARDSVALANQLREDAKRQLVEKALALYIDQGSLTQNYRLLRDRLMVRGGEFIQAVLEEEAPQLGKDGLVSMSTRAAVKVREVQKSLNQMSLEERVDFIRNNGDPRISVLITARRLEAPGVPAQRSPIAENLLKERIQSFGFRVWNDELAAAAAAQSAGGADFAIDGQVVFKRLAARLPASGITIEKVVLTSWTVKCTDKKSGEEIYHNTKVPLKTSWNSEEQALQDIGRLMGEEFNKGFFLRHFHFSGERVRLMLSGLPDQETAGGLLREMTALRTVLTANLVGGGGSQAVIDADLSGAVSNLSDLVQDGILRPINRKLGKTCLSLAGSSGREVSITFDPSCGEPATLGRLSTMPPASLLDAPSVRREDIIKNPDTLKKLSV
jgi:serine/threonine-protein kinase